MSLMILIRVKKKKKNMKKILMLMMAAAMLAACSKDVTEDITGTSGNATANSLLQVTTRSGGSTGEATVSYPVQVYVFQGEECRAVQTIGDAGQTLNIPLVEGTYSVYAVGGASATDYNLPTKEDATSTTALTLKEGKSLTDLMAASAVATLVDGGTNTVTLGMVRKTMMIQDVTIKKIPTAATAVSVTIAPLWQSLTVGGTYSTAGQSQTIALTKQSDNRTWMLPAPLGEGPGVGLLPPSSQPASISVNITIGGTTKTYTYSCSDQLEAGYKINIEGTYTEAVGVNLTGTITGASWLGERTIRFDFDENGSSASEGNTDPTPDPSPTGAGSFPAVGDTYQGCYVLAATVEAGGESAELTLLSPNEKSYSSNTGMTVSTLETVAAAQGTDAVSGWRPMTYSEALLVQAAHTDLGIDGSRKYLFDDNGTVRQMQMSNGSVTIPSSTAAYVRPVATVTISKE